MTLIALRFMSEVCLRAIERKLYRILRPDYFLFLCLTFPHAGIHPRVLNMLSKCSTAELLPSTIFLMLAFTVNGQRDDQGSSA